MSKVALHGILKEQFAPEYNLSVSTPREAVRALCCMVPGFKKSLEEGSYFLYVEDNEIINIDENNMDLSVSGVINIMPEVVGAKKGGLGKALLGVALIGVSIWTGGAAVPFITAVSGNTSLSFAAAATLHGLVTTTAMNVGIALALGGATQLLSPKVKNKASDTEKDLSGASQAEATLANGAAVPIIYGEILAQGAPVSFEISDAQTNYVTDNSDYNNSIGVWEYIGLQGRGVNIP